MIVRISGSITLFALLPSPQRRSLKMVLAAPYMVMLLARAQTLELAALRRVTVAPLLSTVGLEIVHLAAVLASQQA
jgi:hypothetical protein